MDCCTRQVLGWELSQEECVWQHRFNSIEDARASIAKWIEWYNADRPHQALGYKTPDERHAALAA